MSSDIDQDLTYFSRSEFSCQYTGENKIEDSLLLKIDELRERCGFPFIITSGYRSLAHPIERAKKTNTGTHAQGIAADIKVIDGVQRFKIVEEAIKMGFTGIGVASNFVHVDIRSLDTNESPVMWCY
jgi:zinc D-Ala-D-Ala carboxypeptidase|tara:strand:+ start:185 stop:565 length:381 start_codon:yes stop_codon:yes gene_type:complete